MELFARIAGNKKRKEKTNRPMKEEKSTKGNITVLGFVSLGKYSKKMRGTRARPWGVPISKNSHRS